MRHLYTKSHNEVTLWELYASDTHLWAYLVQEAKRYLFDDEGVQHSAVGVVHRHLRMHNLLATLSGPVLGCTAGFSQHTDLWATILYYGGAKISAVLHWACLGCAHQDAGLSRVSLVSGLSTCILPQQSSHLAYPRRKSRNLIHQVKVKLMQAWCWKDTCCPIDQELWGSPYHHSSTAHASVQFPWHGNIKLSAPRLFAETAFDIVSPKSQNEQ